MMLTEADKTLLVQWGHTEDDFRQIEEAMQKSKTSYKLGSKRITRDEAIRLLGRKDYLSGISRSAFHWTATRPVHMSGEKVYFDSSKLFK